MQNRLGATILAVAVSCAIANSMGANRMSSTVINGVHLSLSGPDTLPLAVVRRGSPDYDAEAAFFTVSLKNESEDTKTLPFDELRRNVVLNYRNQETAAEYSDNRTPPPKFDGAVQVLPPGKTKKFEVVFDYPAGIATMKNRVAVLWFCVKWESKWLRKSAYAPGAYDWNESFELCREIRIVDEPAAH
jgi:hypothetical protein